jgi:hypothetical protein
LITITIKIDPADALFFNPLDRGGEVSAEIEETRAPLGKRSNAMKGLRERPGGRTKRRLNRSARHVAAH